MIRTIKTLWTVAAATALEGLQQPVCFLLTLTCVELIILQPIIQLHNFGESGRLARDSGMAFMLVFGFLTVAFTAGFTLAKEINTGTVSVSISKPISRHTFFLGKFSGVILVLAVFSWCASLSVLFAERSAEHYMETSEHVGHYSDMVCGISALLIPVICLSVAAFLNWKFRFRFGLWFFILLSILQGMLLLLLGFVSRTGEYTIQYSLDIQAKIIPAVLLIFMILCIFSAITVTLSIRLQTGSTIAVSAVIMFLGFFADSQFGAGGIINRIIYSMLPDIQHFWMADALADGGFIPMSYLANSALYSVLYISLVLSAGMALFNKRDLG